MAKMFAFVIILVIATPYANAESTPSCTNYKFETTLNKSNGFKTCVDLPVLNSALHYNYNLSLETLEIAYRHPGMGSSASAKWVAWAINPTAKGMVGAQTLVAHRSPKDGSVTAYTSPITSYSTTLAKGDLSFNVTGLTAQIVSNEIIIFATIKVPKNETMLNQLWQEGPLSADGTVQGHPLSGPNVRSMASLNLVSGAVAPSAATSSSLKNAHIYLNAISWGILMPSGIMIARCRKEFFPAGDQTWFYLHLGCQCTGYILGVAGWAIGLKLTRGKREHHMIHRWNGIIIFCLATLQVCALVLRPHKEHKYRSYWNKYHHFVGNLTVTLGFCNISIGLLMIYPHWRTYSAFFAILGPWIFIELILDIIVKNRNKSRVAEMS